jgi:hypothetical protein
MQMTEKMKLMIARNHALATMLTVVVSFTERPDFLGGPLETDEAMQELVRQGGYGDITVSDLESEFNRIRTQE